MFEIIKFGLFQKKLNAFSSDNFNETKNYHLTENQLLKIIINNDTSIISVFDSDGNEKKETSITNRYFYGTDIKGYLIKENWILNSYSGELEKIMIGIAKRFVFPIRFHKYIWIYLKAKDTPWDAVLIGSVACTIK